MKRVSIWLAEAGEAFGLGSVIAEAKGETSAELGRNIKTALVKALTATEGSIRVNPGDTIRIGDDETARS